MGYRREFPLIAVFARTLFVLLPWFSIGSTGAQAQSAGNKAVYDSNSQNPCCAPSTAYVDASVLAGNDICQQIYSALLTLPAAGGVVDARGISSNMTCTFSGETPWLQGGAYLNEPSIIQLPAGTITIGATWILPNGTRLVGEQTATGDPGTTLLASGLSNNTPMIQFGDSHCGPSGCTGISAENVTLNGNGTNVMGILNQNSQFQSYVDHVSLYQILGTGLKVSGSASNSGPYSDITFDTGTYAGAGSTTCTQINGLSGTRGLHGVTCISRLNNATNAILLDASNNSVEDVRIMGFDNGIVIGSQATAHSNTLFNIYGDTGSSSGQVINVIQVSTNNAVTDLSMIGIANAGGSGTYTVRDNLTSTFLTDPSVATYVLGAPGPGGSGYSRFTTSPNAAAWTVGGSAAPSNGCTTHNLGSLYSSTSSQLWVCENSPSPMWQLVN